MTPPVSVVTGPVRDDRDEDDDEGGWLPSDETITVTDRPLYHWSPRARRKQIQRYGLRPNMRPNIHTPGWKPPYVCFADDAAWAWALSGEMRHAPPGTYDLWQTYLGQMPDGSLEFLAAFDGDDRDFHEVRVHARVYKRHLIWVAERVKP